MRIDNSLKSRDERIPHPAQRLPRGNWAADNVLCPMYHISGDDTVLYPFAQSDDVEMLLFVHDAPIWCRGHSIYGASDDAVLGETTVNTTWIERFRLHGLGTAEATGLVTTTQTIIEAGQQMVGTTATAAIPVKGHYLRARVSPRLLNDDQGDPITCSMKLDFLCRSGIVGDGPVMFQNTDLGTGVWPCVLYEPHLTAAMAAAGYQYTEAADTYLIVGIFNILA